jgi:hypothetical protein
MFFVGPPAFLIEPFLACRLARDQQLYRMGVEKDSLHPKESISAPCSRLPLFSIAVASSIILSSFLETGRSLVLKPEQ